MNAPRPERPSLPGLQVGRGLAALIVLMFHAELLNAAYFGVASFGRLFAFGHAGVDFFFVLSGFIIFRVHAGDLGRPERLRSYAVKRFRRVYLPYWAALLLIVPVFFLVPGFGQGFETRPDALLAAVTLFPDPRGYTLAVAWTLSYEIFFYLLFGIAILSPRLGVALIGLWALAGLLLHGDGAWPLSFLAPPHALHFTLGISIARALRRGPVRFAAPLALAGLAAFLLAGRYETALGDPWASWIYGAASGAMVAGVVSLDLRRKLRWPFPLVALGDASYSVYLVHYPALSAAGKALALLGLGAAPAGVRLLLLAVLALAAGVAFHLVVERWALGLRGQASRQPRSGAQIVAA